MQSNSQSILSVVDSFVESLNSFLRHRLMHEGAHEGIIGNIYYIHEACSSKLSGLQPDSGFLHKRERLVSICNAFASPTVLEVGVNGIHSAAIFLLSNPSAYFLGIDMCARWSDGVHDLRAGIYVPAAIDYLSYIFRGRIRFLVGGSWQMLTSLNSDPSLRARVDILHLDAQKELYLKDFAAAIPLLH